MDYRGDTVSVRMSERTKAALIVIAARLQERHRKNITLDDALWTLIEKAEPELAQELREEFEKQARGKGNGH